MKVRFTPKARRRQRTVNKWWRDNRPEAPNLFDDELADAAARLAATPWVGHFYEDVRAIQMRRLLLKKSQQHVYYAVKVDTQEVIIHTIWGTARGRPKL